MNARQVFAAALQLIPVSRLSKIMGVEQRQIYRYAADPFHCESTSPNPIERLQEFVKELKIYGREDIAVHAIRGLASTLGYTLQKPGGEVRDVHHMEALRAVTDFLEAHARGDGFMELSSLRERAVEALEMLWVQRRSEAVSFRRREKIEEVLAQPKKKCGWWPFGRKN